MRGLVNPGLDVWRGQIEPGGLDRWVEIKQIITRHGCSGQIDKTGFGRMEYFNPGLDQCKGQIKPGMDEWRGQLKTRWRRMERKDKTRLGYQILSIDR